MLLEIRPEPSDEERAAIVATVERLLAEERGRNDRAAEWWVAGLREGLEGEDEGL